LKRQVSGLAKDENFYLQNICLANFKSISASIHQKLSCMNEKVYLQSLQILSH